MIIFSKISREGDFFDFAQKNFILILLASYNAFDFSFGKEIV